MRDIKMCGCPKQFVHGLVLPKARVTGIEDPNRTEAIWQFAWDIARQSIDTNEIALAVNPPSRRSQNQLHVHLVRLKPGVNARSLNDVTVRTQNLTNVWAVASESALKHQLKEYGLLVMADPQAGYVLVLTKDSPEALYTQAHCWP
jgi:CDP-diacylglycerol pyrophosphatase